MSLVLGAPVDIGEERKDDWERGGAKGSCWQIMGNLEMSVTFKYTLINSKGKIRCETLRKFRRCEK